MDFFYGLNVFAAFLADVAISRSHAQNKTEYISNFVKELELFCLQNITVGKLNQLKEVSA